MTLRYKGVFPAVVTAFDGNDRIFVKALAHDDTFVLTGQTAGKFGGDVSLFIDAIFSTKIKSNCSLDFDPWQLHGLFTIVSVVSKNGGAMCCTSGSIEPPVIVNCPADIQASADMSCSAVVRWTPPETLSPCNLLSFTSTHSPGDTFPIGQTKVRYMATDINHKVTTCSFNVVVADDTGPVVTSMPGAIPVEAGKGCEARVDWQPPVFKDACSPVTVRTTHKPGSEFPIGMTNVTYTAEDRAGNATAYTFRVTVK